jgi:S1-C subfamily serine protease
VLYRLTTRGIGNRAKIEVVRRGERRTLEVMLRAAPPADPADVRDLAGVHPFDGASVSNIVPGAADDLGVDVQQGVVLLSVRPNSTAARLGFRTGDVVVQVGRDRIANVSQLEGVLQVRQQSWLVLVRRGNQVLRLQLGG